MLLLIRLLTLTFLMTAAAVGPACTRSSQTSPAAQRDTASSDTVGVEEVSLLPRSKRFVNDFAKVLDENAAVEIEEVARELQTKAKVDLAVAIIRSVDKQDISEYSLALARDWHVGSENGRILFVIAVDDRTWHIQIDRRLERDLTNEEVKRAGESMVPHFKQRNYAEGLRAGVETMISLLAQKQRFEPIRFKS